MDYSTYAQQAAANSRPNYANAAVGASGTPATPSAPAKPQPFSSSFGNAAGMSAGLGNSYSVTAPEGAGAAETTLDKQYNDAVNQLMAKNFPGRQQVLDKLKSQYDQARANAKNQDNMQSTLDQFNTMTKDVSGKLANAASNPDQNLTNQYYSEMDAPIQTDFYNQANSVSSYLARQGLGSSGINVAAHSGLEQNKAAIEGQAKLKATDMSIEKGRQELLDEFSTQAMAMQPNLQKYGIDTSMAIAQMQIQAQLEIMRAQLDAQGAAGIGSLVGTGIGAIAGGAPGAMVGNKVGEQVGAGLG